MMKYINISNVYQRQYRGEKRNYMTQLQFFIGWLLLTIILFALVIHFKINIEAKIWIKKYKYKCLCLIKLKFLNIVNTVIREIENDRNKMLLDSNFYIGKLEYRDNTTYSEIVSIYFLISITEDNKLKFSIYKDLNSNNYMTTSFSAYITDKSLFNRKLSKVEKELLISLGLLEDMNIESSRVSVSVSGKFTSDINNIDITDTELENLDLV